MNQKPRENVFLTHKKNENNYKYFYANKHINKHKEITEQFPKTIVLTINVHGSIDCIKSDNNLELINIQL